jgi:hypothetical protein
MKLHIGVEQFNTVYSAIRSHIYNQFIAHSNRFNACLFLLKAYICYVVAWVIGELQGKYSPRNDE